jgi:hypothetical protein
MILGVIIGKFAPNVKSVLDKAKFEGVSVSESMSEAESDQQLWSLGYWS